MTRESKSLRDANRARLLRHMLSDHHHHKVTGGDIAELVAIVAGLALLLALMR